ncbi:MAG: aminopeptidase P family protein [Deltaproteobacteria bacterium]|nr:aminopeptidase P family protein [Candidatus Zymogenaceae bacterium]
MMVHINFPKRIEQIQKELREKKIDVLVGTRLKTITHWSGGFVPWRSALIIPAEGQLTLITPLLDSGRLADESWLDSVVGYGALPGIDFFDMIKAFIDPIAKDGGTVGIEDGTTNYLPEGYITHHEYETLKGMYPNAEFVNAAEITDRLCLVKEPQEIKLMRQATAIVDLAHEEVRKSLRVGMSEKQIAGIAEKVMRDAGSEFAWTFTGGQEIAAGERTWWPLGGCTPATDRLIQLGEPLMVDLHGMYGLFLGDVAHNYIMGKPTKEQQETITAFTETAYKAFDEMQPGKSLKQVTLNVQEFVNKNGWAEWVLPGFGHGIGHLGNEWYPCVAENPSPGNNDPDYILEPGYMQMMAIVCNRPGAAGFRLERPLLITETGNEVLSKLPVQPGIIPCDEAHTFRDR